MTYEGKRYVVAVVNNPHATFGEVENETNRYRMGREIPVNQLPTIFQDLIRARESARNGNADAQAQYLRSGYVYITDFDSFSYDLREYYEINLTESITKISDVFDREKPNDNDEKDEKDGERMSEGCTSSVKDTVLDHADILIELFLRSILQKDFRDTELVCKCSGEVETQFSDWGLCIAAGALGVGLFAAVGLLAPGSLGIVKEVTVKVAEVSAPAILKSAFLPNGL